MSGALQRLYAPRGGVAAVFSAKVTDYVASRPDYPPALFHHLRELLISLTTPGQPRVIADLGAGTGLFTAGLLGLADEVIAVEPNTPMRAAADAWLGGQPGYRSLAGSAEATGLPSASVHLVTAAQCAHWWDLARAREECRRILAPGGRVALVWNDRLATDPLQQDLNGLFADHGGERRKALLADEMQRDPPAFFSGRCEQISHAHVHGLDAQGLSALVFSRSYMPVRDSDAGRAVQQDLDALFQRHAQAGRVAVRYTTLAWIGALTVG